MRRNGRDAPKPVTHYQIASLFAATIIAGSELCHLS
jgi:hypothetical protein